MDQHLSEVEAMMIIQQQQQEKQMVFKRLQYLAWVVELKRTWKLLQWIWVPPPRITTNNNSKQLLLIRKRRNSNRTRKMSLHRFEKLKEP